MAKLTMSRILFLAGIGGAVVLGFLESLTIMSPASWMLAVLAFVGVGIGIANISSKEAATFMVATLLLGVGLGALSQLAVVGKYLAPALLNLSIVILPAGVVVALKQIYDKAQA